MSATVQDPAAHAEPVRGLTALSGRAGTVRRVDTPVRRLTRRLALAVTGVALLLPAIPVAVWAFAERWPFPLVLPAAWGWTGWATVLGQGAAPALGRSLVLGLAVSALATPLGAMAGRALALHRVPCRRLVTVTLLVPVAVPPFAVVLGLNALALRLGVPGAVALLAVLVTAALPYTTFVMRAAYAGHDPGFEEVGRTLGASRWALVRRVHLPLIAPALVVAAFLAFLVGWSDYVFTLVLGAGRLVTLQQLLGASAAGSGNDPTVAALAVVVAVPPVLLLAAVSVLSRRGRR